MGESKEASEGCNKETEEQLQFYSCLTLALEFCVLAGIKCTFTHI